MRELRVALGARSYPIRIGQGLLASPSAFADAFGGQRALIVSDGHVAPRYAAALAAGLAPRSVETLVLPPGEAHKTLDTVRAVFGKLADMKAPRDIVLVALGGGVVGDVTGFAAACWMRGVRFVQVPTTLLAMVDSSVGGKTGVDLPEGKNLVGAFHQPSAVIADLDVLASLPERELRAGLAEIVKTAAIVDADFFAWLEANTVALLARDPVALADAIARSCTIKAGIVARDETEQGERALLNFGHTFGHAIEAEQGYGGLNHGEAVAVGMLCAARLSVRLGLAGGTETERLQALLGRCGLPTMVPAGLDPRALLVRMRLDKKAFGGKLRLILWRGVGRAEIVADIDETGIVASLREAG